ncbi:hypothetical protein H4R20_000222 [Coemansia guatemalensis]|uniref:Uncharacterized protein n=1 Tax=Coemansia guatemalensis TaxID=2761395 RepID=A0A9W8I6P2_9FUNG|nr:hypothetical protein H4R20_000222 [Coemansia guatemalensis]
MIPCRISLLSCSEISPLPPTIHALRQRAAWNTSSNTEGSTGGSTNKEDSSKVESIWAPPYPAKTRGPAKLSYSHEITGERDSHYADMLNAWMCPEVDSRISLARARRRKAQQLAEKMNARAQAEKLEQQALAKRGRKRKNSDISDLNDAVAATTPPLTAKSEVLLPVSPEVTKPQSLLIPELLPKGMLRQRAQSNAAQKADKPRTADSQHSKSPMPPPLELTSDNGNTVHSNGHSFGLGLDLGFDIAQPTPKQEQNQQTDLHADTSSAILEIADFLEKDVDVFTPMSLTHTPRTATFPSQPSTSKPYTTGSGDQLISACSKDRQRELIDDILNMSV